MSLHPEMITLFALKLMETLLISIYMEDLWQAQEHQIYFRDNWMTRQSVGLNINLLLPMTLQFQEQVTQHQWYLMAFSYSEVMMKRMTDFLMHGCMTWLANHGLRLTCRVTQLYLSLEVATHQLKLLTKSTYLEEFMRSQRNLMSYFALTSAPLHWNRYKKDTTMIKVQATNIHWQLLITTAWSMANLFHLCWKTDSNQLVQTERLIITVLTSRVQTWVAITHQRKVQTQGQLR
jgi:hypothetical protein